MSNDIYSVVNDWATLSSKYSEEKLIWCLESCTDKFYNRGERWFFKDDRDAEMFALKYGENPSNHQWYFLLDTTNKYMYT